MILANPLFNELLKLFRLLNKKVRLGLRSYVGHVIVNTVALAPAQFEVGGERDDRGSQCNFQPLKGRLMMP
jgi:hypothetical protein